MDNFEKFFGKPSFENEKFRFWKVKENDNSEAILEVKEGERMFEARVYPVEELNCDLKILSKQDLKTGEIYSVIVKQTAEGKRILTQEFFKDENDYSETIKALELDLGMVFNIDPEKVIVITAKEFEKISKKETK